jgi:hypothetical protein
MMKMKIVLLSIIIVLSISLNAQNMSSPFSYSERIDDDFVPMEKESMRLSPQFKFQSNLISTIQVNTSADNRNIIDDAANEPTLAINPMNQKEMIIGWRQFDNRASNFRQAGIAYSIDGGESWNNIAPIESGVFRTDPVLAVNSEGRFFYNSLTKNYNCDVFSSTDLEDWSEKTYALGGDKQWMVIDNTAHHSNGNIYAFWKQEASDCEGNFTRSLDKGLNYEECSTVDFNPTRGTLSVDPEGILYACGVWNNTFKILRSASARNQSTKVTWELNNVVDLRGSMALYAGPNPRGMLGQVWIATDHSQSAYRSNVYLLCSIARSDNRDPSDIMFSRSIDKGGTWTEAIKINDDNSLDNWQWFGTMSTAPNGRIDVVWLDTRDNPGTYLSSLYYSFSLDGGSSWSPNERVSQEFDPHVGWPNQEKMGDYFHMKSFDDYAYVAWSATFNGEQDIYFSTIKTISTNIGSSFSKQAINVYPNPFRNELRITGLNQAAISKVAVFNLNGKELFSVAYTDEVSKDDKLIFFNSENPLLQGVYIVRITFDDNSQQFRKVVKR